MNWEAVGAIGELLSAVAVVATLIYLAVQIRHSRELLDESRRIGLSTVYAARAAQRALNINHDIESPEVRRVVAAQLGLTEEEYMLRELAQRSIVHIDNVLYQNELGLIPEEDLGRITEVILNNYGTWQDRGAQIFQRVES